MRLTRRLRNGFSTNLLYSYAKSIDNSSTLAGIGSAVAQDFQDLKAERGLQVLPFG
jgi:hypothetical protein